MSVLMHQIVAIFLLSSLWLIPAVATNTQEYIIFPTDFISSEENIVLRDVILRISVDEKVYSEPRRGNSGITIFWTAVLSEAAFLFLKAYPLV